MMPYLAGDDAIGATTTTQSKYLKLTDTQYYLLQKWVEGDFHPAGTSHESCHPGESMTRGVLENCVGGAFSPGIEMTWVSRLAAIYYEPFRIRARPLDDLPDPLSLDYNTGRGMEPGDVTRYMAVPWQADFNECSSQPIGDRILWWWPAQRPEFIYLDPTIKHGLAREAMPDSSMKQAPWIGTDYDQKANNYISFDDDVKMVEHWQELGFVMGKEIDGETRYVQVARTFKAPQYPIDES
jgi:L-lysine 6-oxidase